MNRRPEPSVWVFAPTKDDALAWGRAAGYPPKRIHAFGARTPCHPDGMVFRPGDRVVVLAGVDAGMIRVIADTRAWSPEFTGEVEWLDSEHMAGAAR